MALTHFPAWTDPVVVSTHLATHGYAIVDDLASDELLDRFAAEAAAHVQESAGGEDDYDGSNTRRTGALIAKIPASRELVMHPVAVAVAEGLLHQATAIQLLLTQIITIDPGETPQKLHRDQMMFDLYPFPADYHVQCNTMWALTDFTAENGATHVSPNSSGMTDEEAEAIDPPQAEMKRGSVLFYEGKVLHGGGANRSDDARQGINITYGVGWVRQEENQYLACPPDVARTLDDDLLRMMGYQQGAFSLGYVGDQEDPLSVLRGESLRAARIADFAEASEAHRTFADDIAGIDPSS
jgi:ectoine hydroxylase-related dioxygenase (phytanoyl-CoA dioxygenase family)